jgi:hypothetical protein
MATRRDARAAVSPCNVSRCPHPPHARGLCTKYYQSAKRHQHTRILMNEPYIERWGCECADARHDNWECPNCHRPSYSAERIKELTG